MIALMGEHSFYHNHFYKKVGGLRRVYRFGYIEYCGVSHPCDRYDFLKPCND